MDTFQKNNNQIYMDTAVDQAGLDKALMGENFD